MKTNQLPTQPAANDPATSYDLKKWGVLVCGPGSVLAAHSFTEAATKCAEINRMVIDHMIPRSEAPYSPIFYAQVVIWSDVCEGEHEPDQTDWNEIC